MYVFLFDGEHRNTDLDGYMPFNKQFAFVFTGGMNTEAVAHHIAHEIAHGTFNLRHTFSDKNRYIQSRGTTQNLMDYTTTNANGLNKYQWDLIHNPKAELFSWLEDEGEGEFGIFGVTWFGNYLWGLAPDEQEKQIETNLAIFKHVHQNYDEYFNDSKTNDVNLGLETHKNWSVRKASHQGIAKKVFKGVKEDKTSFSLHNEGIYFEEYTLEERSYKVAVYSKIEAVSLNQDIRVKSFKALRYNKSIKVGYTSDYGLIVFYDADGKMLMALQIGGGNTPKEAVTQWVNYLGLLLPSEEQQEEDKENSIQEMLKSVQLYALEKLSEIWGEEDFIEEEVVDINTNAEKAVNTIKEFKDDDEPACNLCTRAALYYLKNDPVLFPASGSYIHFTFGEEDPVIKGKISGDGSASHIVSDLNDYKNNELKDYFEAISKNDGETDEQFWKRLQDLADKGIVIIGTYKTDHVFMIMAGGVYPVINNIDHTSNGRLEEQYKLTPNLEEGDKYGFSFASRKITSVPRILECGVNIKSSNAPIYSNMDYRGVVNNVKWYKYIK